MKECARKYSIWIENVFIVERLCEGGDCTAIYNSIWNTLIISILLSEYDSKLECYKVISNMIQEKKFEMTTKWLNYEKELQQ